MNKELTTNIDWDDKILRAVILNTVAKGATAAEFRMFVELCKTSGLNPFKKEIWCIVTGDGDYRKVQIMTGINGFFTIANSYTEFDGIEVVESEEQHEVTVSISKWVNKKETYENLTIKCPVSITAKVYRKDRKFPSVFTAKLSEYAQDFVTRNGKLSVWGQKPSLMLAKCAKSVALREAFSQKLGGLYIAEELGSNEIESIESEPVPQEVAKDVAQSIIDETPEVIGLEPLKAEVVKVL